MVKHLTHNQPYVLTKPTALTVGLMVSVGLQLFSLPVAQAAPNKSSALVNTNHSDSDEDAEEALIALKLKQAVENGLIDPSVLDDYKRETLDISSQNLQDGLTSTDSSVANSDRSKPTTFIDQKTDNQIDGDSSHSDQLVNIDDRDNTKKPSRADILLDEMFPNVEVAQNNTSHSNSSHQNNGNNNGTNNTVDSVAKDDVVLRTPVEIEKVLAEVETEVDTEFYKPVATLDSATPPIGFEPAYQVDMPEPSNKDTLGITSVEDISLTAAENAVDDTVVDETSSNASTDLIDVDNKQGATPLKPPLVTDAGSAGRVTAGEDLTNSQHAMGDDTHSDITGEQIAASEEQANPLTDDVTGLKPDEYLPAYQGADTDAATSNAIIQSDAQADSRANEDIGFFKGLYNRWFKGGYAALPRIDATVYLQDESRTDKSGQPILTKADADAQPANNIKAALENITVESISDFTQALPKLREEAINAAQAVGYYDINLRFERSDNDKVAVIIEQLGEPVHVASRVVDIRGEGKSLPAFQTIVESAPPAQGGVFNHGTYKLIKADIESNSERYGFFDAQWLNSSVDVILPDNTADMDLIYDTKQRYTFDDVVFFTIDPDTNRLTTDPKKLPLEPKLLHQLYDFEAGDKFYQPLITSFTNDLSATRYFNMVNVEVVRPQVNNSLTSTLAFDSGGQTLDNNNDSTESINDARKNTLVDDLSVNNPVSDNKALSAQDNPTLSNKNQSEEDDAIAPIEFSIDQQTNERLEAIAEKAQRLTRLPDDRVLDEQNVEAKNLLGKISNAISNTVAKLLPEEESPIFSSTDKLPEDLSATILDDRKTPQVVADSKSVPLYVFVVANKPKDLDLGVGYGTDTGARAVARFEHNLINRQGYQAGATLGVSNINQSLSIHASRPWKHPLNDKLLADLSIERELINQGNGNLDLSSNTIKAGFARDINSHSGWNRTYSLRYRLDELESGVSAVNRKDLPVPFNRQDTKFNQEALLLGYALNQTSTDNVINPKMGWHQYYSIAGGVDSLLTDTDMAIIEAGVNGIYSFGELNRHQVLGSLQGGYIWSDDFESVPYKLRFFAGGDRSIRGYDYHSLSPLENGYLLGGQVLALGSAEYNYEFKPKFRGAVFADVGNAYDKNFNTETKVGVGVGVRWASPVGMVRLDLAAGVLEDSIPIRLHFFIGSPLQ